MQQAWLICGSARDQEPLQSTGKEENAITGQVSILNRELIAGLRNADLFTSITPDFKLGWDEGTKESRERAASQSTTEVSVSSFRTHIGW